jgi:hypothetical protein
MARRLEPIDAVAFGPGSGDRVFERPRRAGALRQMVRWVRREHWSAQIVIVLAAIAVAAVVFVVGPLVGAGIGPMVGGEGGVVLPTKI